MLQKIRAAASAAITIVTLLTLTSDIATGQDLARITLSAEESPGFQMEMAKAQQATLPAIPDTLVAAFTGGVFIGDLVFQSSVSLSNQLAVPVTIVFVRQRDHLGNLNAQSAFNKALEPGESNGFTISYNAIQPTQQQLAQFEIEFTVATPTGQIVHAYKNNTLQSLGLRDIAMSVGQPDTLSLQGVFRSGTTPYTFGIQKSNPAAVSHAFNGNQLELNPTTSGETGITIVATDASGDSETAHFVLRAQSVPIARSDNAAVNEDETTDIPVLQNDTDPDGAVLSISRILTQPRRGAATIAGAAISYAPETNFNGADSLQYEITNGVLTADAWALIQVTPVNDPPEITTSALPGAQVEEPYSFQLAATDVDGDALVYQASGLPAGLSATTSGLISGAPLAGTEGVHDVLVSAMDAAETASRSLTLTVSPPRPKPEAVADTVTTQEDLTIFFNVLDNDINPNNETLTTTIVRHPAHGTLLQTGTGTMQYTPSAEFSGTDGLSYHLEDPRGHTDTTDVVLIVTFVNDPPIAADDVAQVISGDTTHIDVLSNDSDPENDLLMITITDPPVIGQASIDTSQRIAFVAPDPFEGVIQMTYTVNDPGGLTDTGLVRVTVTQANRPPTESEMFIPQPGQPLVLSGSETSRLVFAWTESVDPDGDDVRYRWRLFESEAAAEPLRSRHELFPFFETDMSFLLAVVDSLNGGTGADVTLYQSVDAISRADTTASERSPLLVQRGVFVGVDEEALPRELVIGEAYPNPTRGPVFVDVRAPSSTDVRLRVFDMLGRDVWGPVSSYPVAAGSSRILVPLGPLPRGQYALEVTTGGGHREVRYVVRR
ncbi:MAG: hypothetical protein COV99_07270 [Bacteroidetes bacterium CG12_big_fil_rev_8_21_14_0_65_60_17]|nr:MAG: hypothetical protein COV99_07270 [Bacteroidetes bacterium CG12_big_fil_rev_8_21_14_0_65_60_17]